jgi:hypothetical protein
MDPYSVLGIDSGSDTITIKRAYRMLARKLHPDINPDPRSGYMWRNVQSAYDELVHGARVTYENKPPFTEPEHELARERRLAEERRQRRLKLRNAAARTREALKVAADRNRISRLAENDIRLNAIKVNSRTTITKLRSDFETSTKDLTQILHSSPAEQVIGIYAMKITELARAYKAKLIAETLSRETHMKANRDEAARIERRYNEDIKNIDLDYEDEIAAIK